MTGPLVKRDFVGTLPHELATRILSFLDFQTLSRITVVSRAWNKVANDDFVWRTLCRQGAIANDQVVASLPPLPPPTLGLSPVTSGCSWSPVIATGQWKRLFLNEHTLRQNWARGKCEVLTLAGHTRSVFAARFERDRCVSASYDGTIRVWDLQSGACLRTLEGHTKGVTSVVILGSVIASSSSDRTIKLWGLDTGECFSTFTGHMGEVCSIAVEGQTLVSGSCDHTVRVWDVETGQQRLELNGHQDYVISVQIRDGLIVSGSYDNTVKVWSSHDGACLRTLVGHTG